MVVAYTFTLNSTLAAMASRGVRAITTKTTTIKS